MLSPQELEALRLSLKVATWATLGSLPLAIAVAWILGRLRFPGRALLDAIVHMSLVLPPVAVGYVLLVTLGARAPVGHWLEATLGIRLIFTAQGAAVAAAVMSFPLMVRAIRLSLDAVDPGLEAAARTLGASRIDTFRSVTLPLMLPGILSGCVDRVRIGARRVRRDDHLRFEHRGRNADAAAWRSTRQRRRPVAKAPPRGW